eukprot:SAG11_NODE_35223_length_267_cov_1.547619_1_plen_69_part_01
MGCTLNLSSYRHAAIIKASARACGGTFPDRMTVAIPNNSCDEDVGAQRCAKILNLAFDALRMLGHDRGR